MKQDVLCLIERVRTVASTVSVSNTENDSTDAASLVRHFR